MFRSHGAKPVRYKRILQTVGRFGNRATSGDITKRQRVADVRDAAPALAAAKIGRPTPARTVDSWPSGQSASVRFSTARQAATGR